MNSDYIEQQATKSDNYTNSELFCYQDLWQDLDHKIDQYYCPEDDLIKAGYPV